MGRDGAAGEFVGAALRWWERGGEVGCGEVRAQFFDVRRDPPPRPEFAGTCVQGVSAYPRVGRCWALLGYI